MPGGCRQRDVRSGRPAKVGTSPTGPWALRKQRVVVNASCITKRVVPWILSFNIRTTGCRLIFVHSVHYSVKCPKCSAKATAQMHPMGIRGTYREALTKLGARRIVCEACGFCREVPPGKSESYELWYATYFKGRRLWARNSRHLAFLISWLSGNRSKAGLSIGNRAMVEAFPKWMILAKNRAGILKCLSEMRDEVPNNTTQRKGALERKLSDLSSLLEGAKSSRRPLAHALTGAPNILRLPRWSWPSSWSALPPGRHWPSSLHARFGGGFGADGFERVGRTGQCDSSYCITRTLLDLF